MSFGEDVSRNAPLRDDRFDAHATATSYKGFRSSREHDILYNGYVAAGLDAHAAFSGDPKRVMDTLFPLLIADVDIANIDVFIDAQDKFLEAFLDAPEYAAELFLKELDFTHPEQFQRTGEILRYVRRLMWVGGSYEYLRLDADRLVEYHDTEGDVDYLLPAKARLKAFFKGVVDRKEGNFLLWLFARDFHQTLSGEKILSTEDADDPTIPIVKIARDVYTPRSEFERIGGPYISDPTHPEMATQFVIRYKMELAAFSALIAERKQQGLRGAALQKEGRRLLRALPHKEVAEICAREIQIQDVVSDIDGMDPHTLKRFQDDFDDFVYMHRNHMIHLLGIEGGINMGQLTLREQFHFLRYAKRITVNDGAKKLIVFCKQFDIVGLRAFLANAYDTSASENIMTIAGQKDHDVAQELFAVYARMMDTFDVFAQRLGARDQDVVRRFSHQMYEAIIRRAGHLFRAGKMAAEESDVTFEQVQHAFDGAALVADVLTNFHNPQRFSVTLHAQRHGQETRAFSVQDISTGHTYILKVLIRPETRIEHRRVRSMQGGKDEKREELTLLPRINVELELPQEHPLHAAFLSEQTVRSGAQRTASSVRMAFDLDDIHGEPRLSFDFGRGEYAEADGSYRHTGDVLGRLLDRVAPEGHHLFEAFSPEMSQSENFKAIAAAFDAYIQQKDTEQEKRAA